MAACPVSHGNFDLVYWRLLQIDRARWCIPNQRCPETLLRAAFGGACMGYGGLINGAITSKMVKTRGGERPPSPIESWNLGDSLFLPFFVGRTLSSVHVVPTLFCVSLGVSACFGFFSFFLFPSFLLFFFPSFLLSLLPSFFLSFFLSFFVSVFRSFSFCVRLQC